MKVMVNGEELDAEEGITLYQVLIRQFPSIEMIYVLHNKAYVSHRALRERLLKDGDQITVYRVPSGG